MFMPAARINDMHLCPMQTPAIIPIPHVGGPILTSGAPTVLIGGTPAATLGDFAVCVGPPDIIIAGSFTVLFMGKPAARVGDMCAHGGVIAQGFPTVKIGDMWVGAPSAGAPMGGVGMSAQGATMRAAKADGAAFVQMDCAAKTVVASLGDHPALRQPVKDAAHPAWVEIQLKDEVGRPVTRERYRIESPDGVPYEGWTDEKGFARLEGLREGTCKVTLLDRDSEGWRAAT